MLRKISISSIATILLVTLLLVSILYYLILYLYPDLYSEYDIFFMSFGQFVGSVFLILFIIVAFALIISIVRRIVKCF